MYVCEGEREDGEGAREDGEGARVNMVRMEVVNQWKKRQ